MLMKRATGGEFGTKGKKSKNWPLRWKTVATVTNAKTAKTVLGVIGVRSAMDALNVNIATGVISVNGVNGVKGANTVLIHASAGNAGNARILLTALVVMECLGALEYPIVASALLYFHFLRKTVGTLICNSM